MPVNLFDTEPVESRFRGFVALGAQIASLFVTGCVVWTALLALDALPIMIGWALGLSLLAWCCCAATFAGLHFLLAEPITARNGRTLLRTSTAAVWFAPTAVLLAEYSPAAAVAVLILVVNTTRVLYLEWRLAQEEPERPLPPSFADRLFEDYARPAPALFRELAPRLALASLIQAGAVAGMMRHPLLAAACFALSAALLTALGMAAGAFPPGRPRSLPASAMTALLAVLLAVGLTVGGLKREPRHESHGFGDLSPQSHPGLLATARTLLRQSLSDGRQPTPPKASATHAPAEAAARPYEPTGAGGRVGDNEFPGVIIWPEVKSVTTLVAPIPSAISFSAHAARPLGIPFAGEYWMFRWPYPRPPYGSFFQRGSPASAAFVTTDHAPLEMEAHDRLEKPIDLRCCGKIQLAIWNADRYPGTVSLELILIDTERRGRPSQSLGARPVRSSPGSLPVRETLEFSIPAARELRQFDEFKVVFHRDRSRIDKSARIEIDRFVLVPANSL